MRSPLWEWLSKFILATWPFVIAYHVYVTQKINYHDVEIGKINGWMAQGPRFTAVDAENLRMKVVAEIEAKNEVRFREIQRSLTDIQTAVTRIQTQHETGK